MEKIKSIIREFKQNREFFAEESDYFSALDQLRSQNMLSLEDIGFIESRCDKGSIFSVKFKQNGDALSRDHISIINIKELISSTHGRVNRILWQSLTGFPKLDVLFISHAPDSRGHIYRVKHVCDGLNMLDINADWISLEDLVALPEVLSGLRVLVLFRCEWSSDLELVVDRCKEHGTKIIFDIDDLVFDERLIVDKEVPFISGLSDFQQGEWLTKFKGYRKAMALADVVSVPTESLKEQVELFFTACFVFPNTFDRTGLTISQYARRRAEFEHREHDIVTLGYASGTPTHEADFETIKPVLLDLLSEYPGLRIRIVGNLDGINSVDFINFRDRISVRSLVPHSALPFELAAFDINLIPLDRSTFTDSKSELKFFEAALLRIPSVAVANPVYRRAINHGKNGFLAENHSDWKSALSAMIEDAQLRVEVGDHAFSSVVEKYSARNLMNGYKHAMLDFD